MNVLIVDDNEAAAELLGELLTLQDHCTHCCHTAQQALDAAARAHYDAVLIDLSLPDLPGTEVARRLRSAPASASRPQLLVAISGYATQDAAGTGARPLFDHYLEKPIDLAALEHILAAPGAPAVP